MVIQFTKQLKYWLDPLKTGAEVLNGVQFNEGENLCAAFSNLTNNDKYEVVSISGTNGFTGYWGGSNNLGITEFMEHFSVEGNEILSGISIGVGKFKNILKSSESEILIKVYTGNKFPEKLIYSQVEKTAGMAENAMNFIGFNEPIEPNDDFFIGFELKNIQPMDSFVVYQSVRAATDINTFLYKQNGEWVDYKDETGKSMANIFEIVACNIDDFGTDTQIVENPLDIRVFPNPANSKVTVETGQKIPDNKIAVFNILGQDIKTKITKINDNKVEIDLAGNIPGVYIIRFQNGESIVSHKISYVPW
ncbi:MAG: T9SS type A sorting domain-containing protein [Draconibacterium sp.]|nr:T9SS type A sorting domain-containing protein [Draconibacterium sp.]